MTKYVQSDKVLPQEDRLAIDYRVREAINTAGSDAAIAFGTGNFTYATGVVLPFAEQYAEPRAAVLIPAASGERCIIVCPFEWTGLVEQQGWTGRIKAYTTSDGVGSTGLLNGLKELCLESRSIGLDFNHIPQQFFEDLENGLSPVEYTRFDSSWQSLRIIKTDGEITLLEEAARQMDRGFVSGFNHMEGCALDTLSYSLWEFTERIRVHVGEFGGSATGHLTTLQGADTQFYTQPPEGNFVNGNLVRSEATSHHYGYWANGGRTFFVGQPTSDAKKAYADNIALKQLAVRLLCPGAVSSDIYAAVADQAVRAGVDLWGEPGIGHGVGTSEREAPFICSQDKTVLKTGMVVMLAIYTRGPAGELIVSKDTYKIVDGGSELLSWYRDWDAFMYRVEGNTARHG
jgi:Xaa-Pro aminopeptidase